jgi:hypothetical protein
MTAADSPRHQRTDLYDLNVVLTYPAPPHPPGPKFELSRELIRALKADDLISDTQFGPPV